MLGVRNEKPGDLEFLIPAGRSVAHEIMVLLERTMVVRITRGYCEQGESEGLWLFFSCNQRLSYTGTALRGLLFFQRPEVYCNGQ